MDFQYIGSDGITETLTERGGLPKNELDILNKQQILFLGNLRTTKFNNKFS